MKILLALTAAIFAASLPASAYGLYGDEWLGIEGLRIADVHHTEGYIRGIMNLSGERWTPTLGTGTSDVAGVWSFTLTGEVSRRLDLTLYQAEGEVFGEGTLAADGAAWQVAVAGERAYNQLDLRCVVLGSPSLIRLWLGLSTSPARGTVRRSIRRPGLLEPASRTDPRPRRWEEAPPPSHPGGSCRPIRRGARPPGWGRSDPAAKELSLRPKMVGRWKGSL